MKKGSYISNFSLKLYNLCQRHPVFRKLKVVMYFIDSFLLIFIPKPKRVKNKKKQVFIMYNYAFGDGIIMLCTYRYIRKIYPKDKYEITLICQKGLQSIYENEGVFDKVLAYDLTKSTFDLVTRFKLYKLLRKKYYDIVIDSIGCAECTTNVFMSRVLKADEKITLLDKKYGEITCPKWLYNKVYTKIFEVDKKLPLIEYYAEMFRNLGEENFEVKLEKTKTKNLKIKTPKDYFIVFPSASTKMKIWPLERYAEIIKKTYEKTNIPLLFCGTEKDSEYILKLKEMIDVPSYEIIGKTSLLGFIEVIKKAKFVITNDTSTYHIAVTNEIPVTIITGGYTYDRYVKYDFKNKDKYRKPYFAVHKMKCFDCDNKCSKLKSTDKIWPCLDKVTVEYAWKIIQKMIDEEVMVKK